MAFMQKQIEEDTWYEVDTKAGISFIPVDVVGKLDYDDDAEDFTVDSKDNLLQYLEVFKVEDIYSVEERKGFGARMSAPGYLDCTEWAVFDTYEEANAYLDEYYGDEVEDEWIEK